MILRCGDDIFSNWEELGFWGGKCGSGFRLMFPNLPKSNMEFEFCQ